MISNQDVTSVFIIIIILIFYFFQVFQRVKLLYLFRSAHYHFTNIFFPYNPDDLNIHGKINYFHYFYIFFYTLITAVIMAYLTAFTDGGIYKFEGISNELFLRFFSFNLFIYVFIFIRFLIINYITEIFLGSKLKFVFFKNYIINIIIGLLLLINFIIYNLNSIYTINSLKNTFLILIGFHFIFQAKNYLSLIIKSEPKEIMYLILYLCAFKLAPWLWLYSFLFPT